jgi:hypothetical protein
MLDRERLHIALAAGWWLLFRDVATANRLARATVAYWLAQEPDPAVLRRETA